MYEKREPDDNEHIPENEYNRCQGLHLVCCVCKETALQSCRIACNGEEREITKGSGFCANKQTLTFSRYLYVCYFYSGNIVGVNMLL